MRGEATKILKWTEFERTYPHIILFVDEDGETECPVCHGQGEVRQRNYATLSPSDDYYSACEKCDGQGWLKIEDDRYA